MSEELREKLLPTTVREQINLNLADQKAQSSQILQCKLFHSLR